MRWMKHCRYLALVLLLLLAQRSLAAAAVIVAPADSAPVRFAVAELGAALRARGVQRGGLARPELTIAFRRIDALAADPKTPGPYAWLRPEGFALRRERHGATQDISIVSRDDAGAMYGGLELAEQIRALGLDGVV